jgi:hypothetical protein
MDIEACVARELVLAGLNEEDPVADWSCLRVYREPASRGKPANLSQQAREAATLTASQLN